MPRLSRTLQLLRGDIYVRSDWGYLYVRQDAPNIGEPDDTYPRCYASVDTIPGGREGEQFEVFGPFPWTSTFDNFGRIRKYEPAVLAQSG